MYHFAQDYILANIKILEKLFTCLVLKRLIDQLSKLHFSKQYMYFVVIINIVVIIIVIEV